MNTLGAFDRDGYLMIPKKQLKGAFWCFHCDRSTIDMYPMADIFNKTHRVVPYAKHAPECKFVICQECLDRKQRKHTVLVCTCNAFAPPHYGRRMPTSLPLAKLASDWGLRGAIDVFAHATNALHETCYEPRSHLVMPVVDKSRNPFIENGADKDKPEQRKPDDDDANQKDKRRRREFAPSPQQPPPFYGVDMDALDLSGKPPIRNVPCVPCGGFQF